MEFNDLIRKTRKLDTKATDNTKVAVLGHYATQYFCKALVANGKLNNTAIDLYEADFDQIDLEALDPNSSLYHHDANYTILLYDSKILQLNFLKLSIKEKNNFAQDFITQFSHTVDNVFTNSKSKVITFNLAPIKDDILNLLSFKKEHSFAYQLQLINIELTKLSFSQDSLFVLDASALFFKHGMDNVYSSKLYVTTSQPYDLNFIPALSNLVINLINSLSGRIQKCLILDLDNTLWGGIIGDDGINKIEIGDLGDGKIFTEIQLWAKNLKERGVILCVCSKNDEAVAKAPFEQLDSMELGLEDISVFVANWNNKADNIRSIQKVLNIGLDAMVFIDDNPAEREIVRDNLPEVCVPELPEAPENYMKYLSGMDLFSTVSYSALDKDRTNQYQAEAKRISFKQTTNIGDYLKSLKMEGITNQLNDQDISRIAQLTQRSNQFNLRTQRFSENDLISWAEKERNEVFSFSLKDRFGNYGIIAVIMIEGVLDNLNSVSICNWMMSCRVLKRGVEKYCMNFLAKHFREKGIKNIYGEYVPSAKNNMVRDHYQELGFSSSTHENLWEINISNYDTKDNYIN
jgi:FkbH-like protein